MLQRVQAEAGYLPAAALMRVASSYTYLSCLCVATFHHQFSLRPKVNTSSCM
jgi:NADH:ubiquinone oxidoreductase subunit E